MGYFSISEEEARKFFDPVSHAPTEGPGTELKKLLHLLGIDPATCKCSVRAALMNAWGVDGCREHRWIIIEWMEESASLLSWREKMAAGTRAILNGIPLTIPALVDEAIRLSY